MRHKSRTTQTETLSNISPNQKKPAVIFINIYYIRLYREKKSRFLISQLPGKKK